MKNSLIAVLAVAILALGYFVFIKNPSDTGAENVGDVSQSGKLDINIICDNALAYMSFPDAASAELFLSECKEGNRPEVIEQYKAQMNIGADVAI